MRLVRTPLAGCGAKGGPATAGSPSCTHSQRARHRVAWDRLRRSGLRKEQRNADSALVTTAGEALGTIELGRPDWPDGVIIYRGEKPNLRVVGQLATDDSEHGFDVLVVEET